ncbi:angiotensin-converting enzyme-like [Montipora foliosa]|uniref:angiotensin-converting enzyme-like n=1 Tax=Montipora foliosa TaxID=591990 RepID=UPI0035F1309B
MGLWILRLLFLSLWGRTCICTDLQNVTKSAFKNYTAIATNFLNNFEIRATKISLGESETAWKYETNLTETNREFSVFNSTFAKAFFLKASEDASRIKDVDLPNDMGRQIRIIRRNALPKSPKDMKLIEDLVSNMTKIYSTGQVCKSNNLTNETHCLDLDPDLYELMGKSREYNELLWAWKGWRDAVGPPIRPLYEKLVVLLNDGARRHGWGDYGNFQRSEYEMGNDFQSVIKKLWNDIKPLYQELHAYVRHKLRKKYPQVPENGTIQAHLLGNMWAQDWSSISDLVKPYPKVPSLDVTPNLIKQQYTPTKMFKLAQSFFVSLGLDPMPNSFWNRSVFNKPKNRKVVCHPSAWDFGRGDVRIKMCTAVNQENLITIHHEMGHCEYYLAYKDLPYAYRSGANPGFHEAIGDSIALSVENPKHLKSVGLLYTIEDNLESDINFLMEQALLRVASLPFTYLVDQWRWKVFSGSITPTNYNSEWWRMRMRYQGVMAPVPRTEQDFDPGAKFHVGANYPYISYFVSLILQFQFHRALCNIAKHSGPLYKCSIYKSKEAGLKFREMLAAGRSRPWPQTLYHLTGERAMTAGAMMEYFAPLQDWLIKYRIKEGYTVGWSKRKVQNSNPEAIGARKTLSSSTSVSENEKIEPPANKSQGVNLTSSGKEGASGVTFPEVKTNDDTISLGKPDLKAALAAMEPSLKTSEETSVKTTDNALLDPKSAIFGAKPMFVPNKIKDQLDLG